MNKKVAIFAGSGCAPEKQKYYFELAYNTGKILAENGFVTITGAGPGLMAEAARGAREAGGKTIGIGLDLGEKQYHNHIDEISIFNQLSPRQNKVIELADAYIALPGGIGTLFEISNVLAIKRLGEMPKEKPLVLVDGYFYMLKNIFDAMITEGFWDGSVYSLYSTVNTPKEAVEVITRTLSIRVL